MTISREFWGTDVTNEVGEDTDTNSRWWVVPAHIDPQMQGCLRALQSGLPSAQETTGSNSAVWRAWSLRYK